MKNCSPNQNITRIKPKLERDRCPDAARILNALKIVLYNAKMEPKQYWRHFQKPNLQELHFTTMRDQGVVEKRTGEFYLIQLFFQAQLLSFSGWESLLQAGQLVFHLRKEQAIHMYLTDWWTFSLHKWIINLHKWISKWLTQPDGTIPLKRQFLWLWILPSATSPPILHSAAHVFKLEN